MPPFVCQAGACVSGDGDAGADGGGASGAPIVVEEGGCGCEVPGTRGPRPGSTAAMLLVAAAAVLARRRREAGGAQRENRRRADG